MGCLYSFKGSKLFFTARILIKFGMAAATGDKQKFGVLKFIFFMHPLPFGIELCKVLVKFLKKQGLSFANAGSWQLTFFCV